MGLHRAAGAIDGGRPLSIDVRFPGRAAGRAGQAREPLTALSGAAGWGAPLAFRPAQGRPGPRRRAERTRRWKIRLSRLTGVQPCMNYRIAVKLGLCAGRGCRMDQKRPMPASLVKPGEHRRHAPAGAGYRASRHLQHRPAHPYGHGGLRTVRLGGEARRSAARRDLAAGRCAALLVIIPANAG